MKRIVSSCGLGLFLAFSSGCVTETIKKNADQPELTLSASTIDRESASGIIYLHVKARVQQGQKMLMAEHIEIDKNTGTLFCNENCVYRNGKTVKKAESMKLKIVAGNWIVQNK